MRLSAADLTPKAVTIKPPAHPNPEAKFTGEVVTRTCCAVSKRTSGEAVTCRGWERNP